jgi:uncharacterized small protein (DUF1192 family)
VAISEDEAVFGAPRKKTAPHEIGENLDNFSAPELADRIEALRAEIRRLEAALQARDATRAAASAFFKA